ncbi:hypothetical protein EVAR_37147_1 [Eumeta japonica]|uniref:Uncharacterized protein n=1 Tax=Eumeta variegata TaxID=151549 RepID=A0A4C1WJH1_EUMVA|nr:hypothetical protein EVAR_37147_1 [Eumeta japonica]
MKFAGRRRRPATVRRGARTAHLHITHDFISGGGSSRGAFAPVLRLPRERCAATKDPEIQLSVEVDGETQTAPLNMQCETTTGRRCTALLPL